MHSGSCSKKSRGASRAPQGDRLAHVRAFYNPTTLAPAGETLAYDLNADGTPDFTRVLDRSQDSLQRDSGWQLKDGITIENQVTYGYDTAGRLASVTSPAGTFSYAYQTNSMGLLSSVTGPAHTVTNTWESTRDVLASKQNQVGTSTVSAYGYSVNTLGQRTEVAKTGSAFASNRSITWGYDALGQVTKADSSITGFDRAYEYDGIGNRKKAADSLTLPATDNYTANALNQYTAVETINPAYDDDGNATAYPLPAHLSANSTLAWDAENRLVSATVNGTTTTYLYDSGSRRIAQTTGSSTTVYIYDAWNPVAEYTGTTLARTYTWGLDLSGSLQGAGGVGGLLAVSVGTTSHFPTYDGNGNVSEYLDSAGATVAHYEYDPFGRTTVASGTLASDFAHRFSTKPIDVSTGLYYYGYRHFDPVTGRWPSRDPIGEQGGMNLFAMIENDPVAYVDFLGYWKIYDALKSQPNYRLELSISALTRKFNLPRIPLVHDSLESYGILFESKQVNYEGENCVEVAASAYGNVGALKNTIRSAAKKVPFVKKYAEKIDADVILSIGGKIIDCPCFDRTDLIGKFDLKIQASGGYGVFGGNRSVKSKNYRTGKGGMIDLNALNGIRGPFVGVFAEWGIESAISDEGLDIELKGGISGFLGARGDWADFRAGGEINGKWTFSILPQFGSKGGDWNATWF
jgi:RHS repeat-associated protein